MVSRQLERWPNLVVDVEDYKARREKSLVGLAGRMADRVRTTDQPVNLEPMPAHERRIVHLALSDDPDVYTESTGQDEKRKVVIYPKK
jgi:spoIIIJ-associated protein